MATWRSHQPAGPRGPWPESVTKPSFSPSPQATPTFWPFFKHIGSFRVSFLGPPNKGPQNELKQLKYILSQFWRLEFWNQVVGRVICSEGKSIPSLSPVFWWQPEILSVPRLIHGSLRSLLCQFLPHAFKEAHT